MPHITIEYSANVANHHDIGALVHAVHTAGLGHELPSLDALRTRAARRDHFEVASGSENLAFVAIAVRVGPGRDAALKTNFIETLLDAAEGQLAAGDEGSPLAIAWSIELHEIDPDYRINRNHVRKHLAEQRSTGHAS